MKTQPDIKYLSRQQVDEGRWSACLEQSGNGLIYGNPHYLDAMCSHWDALVLNNYEAVMALPWRKKWGIRYIYQPAFIQQTGIFSVSPLSPQLVEKFLEQVYQQFSYGELNINTAPETTRHQQRNNYTLLLDKDYADIAKGYREDLRKNLKEAKKHSLQYHGNSRLEDIILLYRKMYQGRMGFEASDYEDLEILIRFLGKSQQVVTRSVFMGQEMVSGAICLKDARRLYLLVSATSETGRKLSANHYLVDSILQEFSGSKLLFDFEGSDQPGIAHFYKNFGGENQPYYFTAWNRLPWPLRKFKPLPADD